MNIQQFFSYLQSKLFHTIPQISLEEDGSYARPILKMKLEISCSGTYVYLILSDRDDCSSELSVGDLYSSIADLSTSFGNVEIFVTYRRDELDGPTFKKWFIVE